MAEFVRLAEVVNKKKDMRIVSVTVIPTIADCSGRIWFTDLQLQEGPGGWRDKGSRVVQRRGALRGDGHPLQPGEDICAAGYPHLSEVGYGGGDGAARPGRGRPEGGVPGGCEAEDDIALLASARECKKNGAPAKKEGFYQYSTAWDSKHKVALESGKTARLLFSMQEMQEGGGTF